MATTLTSQPFNVADLSRAQTGNGGLLASGSERMKVALPLPGFNLVWPWVRRVSVVVSIVSTLRLSLTRKTLPLPESNLVQTWVAGGWTSHCAYSAHVTRISHVCRRPGWQLQLQTRCTHRHLRKVLREKMMRARNYSMQPAISHINFISLTGFKPYIAPWV